MVRRGDPPPHRSQGQPTIGDAISQYEMLVMTCEDCKRAGLKYSAEEFAAFHKLPRTMTLWALAQRLYCGSCGSRNVLLETEPPAPYSQGYRMRRKSFER